ncbi:MAG: cohesin domain-containing protein, partial [Oscillospiraceae bacterium]
MKKLLKAVSTISLCLLLLLGYIPAADAAGIPTIGGSSHTAGRSDTVPFAISISNNPGIASFDIYIKCDANIFDIAYDSVGATYDISPGSAATQGTFCSYKKENGRWGATWVKMANLKADGQLVIFNLKIADNAPYGEYQIEVGYLPSNTVNEQEQPVILTAVAGSVKVVSKMPLFEGTNITTHQGREFDYPIIVKRNSGISGCKVFVECDTSIFTPVLDGEAVKVTNGNISTNASVVANTYGTTGFQVAWMDSSNKTANGTVFTLRLKSAQNAQDGIYPVKISYDMANTVSEHGQKVDFECANGGITLSSEKSLTASAISYDKSKKQV